MAPNATSSTLCTGVLTENDVETVDGGLSQDFQHLKKAEKRKLKLVWRNIIVFALLHMAAIYGAWLMLTSARIYTGIFAMFLYSLGILGITAAAHRYWSHRSYKAKLPLQCILAFCNTLAFQDCAMHWARDHRVHHKFSETDADPHNATRGLFFSHVGWLLCKKHPDVIAKGKCIDVSDLETDSVLIFQKKYYMILMPLICFILPTLIPYLCWNETLFNSWFVATIFRYTLNLNVTWLVNSAAHKWGDRPYDKNINPTNHKIISAIILGEGYHNYHHVFPWDYKSTELGNYYFNLTTIFIDFFAKIGWAYDLKTVSHEIIEKRVKRTGDGSHPVWGWGDKDQSREEIEQAVRINKKEE